MNRTTIMNKMSPIQKLIIKVKKCYDKEQNMFSGIKKDNYGNLSTYNTKVCEKPVMIYSVYSTEFNYFRQQYNQMITKKIQNYNHMSYLPSRNNTTYTDVIDEVTRRINEYSTTDDTVGLCIMLEAFKNAFYIPLTSPVIYSNKKSTPITPMGQEMDNYTKQLMLVTKQKCNDPNMSQLINQFLGYSNNFQDKLQNLSRRNSGIGVSDTEY